MMKIVCLFSLVGFALAGSPCPPRENIYPCSCIEVPMGKNSLFTTISCHHLENTDSLNSITRALRTIVIDRFYIYDSFWRADSLESNREDKRLLPENWLTTLKTKEIHIIDSTLSSCFACNFNMLCRNDITTRFTAINSSSHDTICTLCDIKKAGSPRKFPWIACMNRLQQFHFQHGKLAVLKNDTFSLNMKQLIEVDFSHNEIAAIEKDTFKYLNKLKILRLSHNLLDSIANITNITFPELEELDVGWNQITELDEDFISAFPMLKTLVLNNNHITQLKEEDWKNLPKQYIKIVDLRENPIECGCSISWINSTFPVHTAIQGHCADPEEFEDWLIRTASRWLVQRCTEDGLIGTRKPVTKAIN